MANTVTQPTTIARPYRVNAAAAYADAWAVVIRLRR